MVVCFGEWGLLWSVGLRCGRSTAVTWPLLSATPWLAQGTGLHEQSGHGGNNRSHAASSHPAASIYSAEGPTTSQGRTSCESPEWPYPYRRLHQPLGPCGLYPGGGGIFSVGIECNSTYESCPGATAQECLVIPMGPFPT